MVAVTCAVTVLALMLAWSIWRAFRPRSSFINHPVVFFLLVCGALLFLRLPQIKWKCELDADESALLAEGMRFLSHPVPWRDIDNDTSGPLNSVLLSVPMCFGAPATWRTARLVLWGSTCLTLFFLYLTLRSFGTRAEAQFVLLPTVFYYAFSSLGDFVHYSSETLPVLLLSTCLYLLAREWAANKPAKLRLFLLGLVGGSIPFAKLQAAPLALFLLVIGLAQIAACHRKTGRPWRTCWREPLALGLGATAVPALLLGVVTVYGALGDFWKSYILAAGYYVKEPFESRFHNLHELFLMRSDATLYLVGTIAALLLLSWACAASRERLPGRLLWPLLAMLAYGVVTAACLVFTGKQFWHYLSLFVPPLALVCGLVFFVGKTKLNHRSESELESSPKRPAEAAQERALPRTTLAFSLWLLLFSLFVAGIHFCRVPFYLHQTRGYCFLPIRKELVVEFVSRVSGHGDSLSVWGWVPAYYVQTGLMPATRYAHCHYQISPGPYQSYFRNRYLEDLEQSRPVVFIDAVARGVFLGPLGKADKHESFPALARFIDENYALWVDIKIGEGDSPVRLYLLKERLAKLTPLLANPASPTRTQ